MATTSTQQTNGANTLIVSSSLPLSIPLSSTSQLSSAVNTSALAGSQPSLITANHIQSPFGIQLYPHDFQQQVQLYQQQQQQMFLQPQPAGLPLQQNLIQTASEQQLNQALVKKKNNKQQKIVSKTTNQLPKSSNNQQLSTVLKSSMITGQPQFTTQNNQAVIINQLPNVQQALANKKILEQHKNKFVIQNNQITQQQIISPQFKHQLQNNAHLQLTSQSPLINQAQLIAQPIQQPQLTWTSNHVQRPIIIGQPTHASAEGQQLFIQNPGTLQAMQGGQFYVNQNQGALMQLVSNPQANLNSVTAQLTTTSSNSTPSTPTSNLATVTPQAKQINNNSSTSKLKFIRPASSSQGSSATSSPQISSKQSKPIVSNKLQQQNTVEDSHKKLGKKQQQQLEQEKLKKSTQQMNNELILSKNNLQRSESLKSLDSAKSKGEGKLKKQQSSSIDDDSSSLSSNSKLNNNLSKKDKSEKKIKQKAIVKPIISHYVGGYIIHESSQPFPVNLTEELNDELEQIKLNNSFDKNQFNQENSGIKEGKTKLKKLKKSKSKLNNINNNQIPSTSNINVDKDPNQVVEMQNKKNSEISPATNSEDVIIINNSNNSSDGSDSGLDERNVLNWSVEQVYEYLIKHDASEATAKELSNAQINGRSLVLLSLQILTKDKFGFKLGPSLSLKKKIDELKEKANLSEDKIENYLPSSGNLNINDWSVKDTKEFILNLSSEEHADEFEKQEIDGKSLNLISYDNIINDLNLPFGPALVIYSKIEELKKLSNK